jgi:protein O-mannosyl-transferase
MASSKKRRAERRQATAAPAKSPTRTDLTVAATPAAVSYTPWLLGTLLAAACLVAYVPAIRGEFIWDDNLHITNNQVLRAADGLWRIWFERGAIPQYYPLVHTTFWAEYRLWGLSPTGYHVVNVLLHTGSALVLWRLLVRLAVPGAWFAAALFALHPVQVESVAWATERKNVLSLFFYLLAFGAYLRFAGTGDEDPPPARRPVWYAIALVLFACALFSKTVTASLPAAILLVRWWKRGRIGVGDVAPLLPMFVLGALGGGYTAWVERTQVGAVGDDWALSVVDRCLIAGRAVTFYATKLAWPYPLIFVYPRWRIDATAWWQYLFPLGALAVVGALWWLRDRIGRGPLVAVLFFGGTLVPALGFVNVFPMRYSFVADHFQYHASIGLLVLAGALAAVAANRLGMSPSVRMGAAGVVLAVLGALTWSQGLVYRDLETLYRDTLAKNSEAFMAHNNLARILEARGDMAGAHEHYAETVRIKPNYAEGRNNYGVALERMGRKDDAISEYREAVRMEPKYVDANSNLGRLLLNTGRPAEAVEPLTTAARERPTFAPAFRNLGRAYQAIGDVDRAIDAFAGSVRVDPNNADARLQLGILYEQRGDTAKAIEQLSAAVRLDPKMTAARERLTALQARGQ